MYRHFSHSPMQCSWVLSYEYCYHWWVQNKKFHIIFGYLFYTWILKSTKLQFALYGSTPDFLRGWYFGWFWLIFMPLGTVTQPGCWKFRNHEWRNRFNWRWRCHEDNCEASKTWCSCSIRESSSSWWYDYIVLFMLYIIWLKFIWRSWEIGRMWYLCIAYWYQYISRMWYLCIG